MKCSINERTTKTILNYDSIFHFRNWLDHLPLLRGLLTTLILTRIALTWKTSRCCWDSCFAYTACNTFWLHSRLVRVWLWSQRHAIMIPWHPDGNNSLWDNLSDSRMIPNFSSMPWKNSRSYQWPTLSKLPLTWCEMWNTSKGGSWSSKRNSRVRGVTLNHDHINFPLWVKTLPFHNPSPISDSLFHAITHPNQDNL